MLRTDHIVLAKSTDGLAHAYRHHDDGLAEQPICSASVARLLDPRVSDQDDVCEQCHESVLSKAVSVEWERRE